MGFDTPSTSITVIDEELTAVGKALVWPLILRAQSQYGIRKSFAAAT
jgi:hypothetical protein